MTDHPITPPPELVRRWIKEYDQPGNPRWEEYEQDIATRAAQWGADTELEACCDWMSECTVGCPNELRAVRRPKPSSLKEQALKEMDKLDAMWDVTSIEDESLNTIRRALEALPND